MTNIETLKKDIAAILDSPSNNLHLDPASKIAFTHTKIFIESIFNNQTPEQIPTQLSIFNARQPASLCAKDHRLQALSQLLTSKLSIQTQNTFFPAYFEALFNRLATLENPMIMMSSSFYSASIDDCFDTITEYGLVLAQDWPTYLPRSIESLHSEHALALFSKLADLTGVEINTREYFFGKTVLEVLISHIEPYFYWIRSLYQYKNMNLTLPFIIKLLHHPDINLSDSNKSALKRIILEMALMRSVEQDLQVQFIMAVMKHDSPNLIANMKYSFETWQPTILYMAAQNGFAQTVQCLIAHGAKIDDQSSHKGETALHTAVQHYQFPTVEILLKMGANANLADQVGKTALYTLCIWFNSEEVLPNAIPLLLSKMDRNAITKKIKYAYSDAPITALDLANMLKKLLIAEAIEKRLQELPPADSRPVRFTTHYARNSKTKPSYIERGLMGERICRRSTYYTNNRSKKTIYCAFEW